MTSRFPLLILAYLYSVDLKLAPSGNPVIKCASAAYCAQQQFEGERETKRSDDFANRTAGGSGAGGRGRDDEDHDEDDEEDDQPGPSNPGSARGPGPGPGGAGSAGGGSGYRGVGGGGGGGGANMGRGGGGSSGGGSGSSGPALLPRPGMGSTEVCIFRSCIFGALLISRCFPSYGYVL